MSRPTTRAWLLPCAAAYLYGSIPFVYALGVQRRIDLRRVGSGNVGGSNLWATGGAARAVVGWLFDASKGFLPILLCRRRGLPDEVAQLTGVCGAAGQCWPVSLRFNGGRGISAFVGAAFLIDRTAWAVALLPLIGGSLWRLVRSRAASARPSPTVADPPASRGLAASRSKSVPFGCLVGVLVFPLACAALRRRGNAGTGAGPAPAPGVRAATLLAVVLLLRRLTAPLPDDAAHGPRVRRRALLFRLLYDRNTSD